MAAEKLCKIIHPYRFTLTALHGMKVVNLAIDSFEAICYLCVQKYKLVFQLLLIESIDMVIFPSVWGTASIVVSFTVAGVIWGNLFQPAPALAQITPDETLEEERSIVIRGVVSGVDAITGGATRRTNIFHSFEQFNIDAGQRVYFFPSEDITNILSRVTGNDPSDILGTLGVLGDANLFFLNPNGIIFGENASLDIRGSFFATTADAIQFGNQGFFSATNPEAPPLLTVNPSALLFNQIQRGNIANRSIAFAGTDPIGEPTFGLRVGTGSTLTLLGGNVNLEGGRLNALGGRAEIGAVAAIGTIALNPDGSLSFPSNVERSDVSLTNGAVINTAAGGAGEITINARNINLSDESTLVTGILPGFGGEGARSGDIQLDAQDIRIDQFSEIQNTIPRDALGIGGNINITTGSLSVTNGSRLSTNIHGQGIAGNVLINASEAINLANGATLLSESYSPGTAGDVIVNSDTLTARTSSYLSSSTYDQGDAGDVIIRARLINFDTNQDDFADVVGFNRGYTGAYSTSEAGTGNAG